MPKCLFLPWNVCNVRLYVKRHKNHSVEESNIVRYIFTGRSYKRLFSKHLADYLRPRVNNHGFDWLYIVVDLTKYIFSRGGDWKQWIVCCISLILTLLFLFQWLNSPLQFCKSCVNIHNHSFILGHFSYTSLCWHIALTQTEEQHFILLPNTMQSSASISLSRIIANTVQVLTTMDWCLSTTRQNMGSLKYCVVC